ncbi:MAG TPA: DinB family protein [Promineifilum sp.]|nr:DinB family protein [Promineifilum sp.]
MLPARTLLNPPPTGELLAELAAFRERIIGLLADAAADWSRRPADAEWSLTEIACHLRDVEREVHQARFQALLEDSSAFLPGVDADEWAITRHYRAQDGRAAAAAFVAARAETITRLAPLPPEVWETQGQHTFFGPTSLHELVHLAVQHDRVHGQQIDMLRDGSAE